MKIWQSICDTISGNELRQIACADYESDYTEHLNALRSIRAMEGFFSVSDWHPREVLSLYRWREIDKDNALSICFCSCALLIGSFYSDDDSHLSMNDDIAILIESCRFLDENISNNLPAFFELLISKQAVCSWEEEEPFLYLGLALSNIFFASTSPGSFTNFELYIDSFERAALGVTKNDDPETIFDLSFHDSSNALWIRLISESKLYGVHPTLKYS